jgi:hypothetical protein
MLKRQQKYQIVGVEDCVANRTSAKEAIRLTHRMDCAAENLGKSSPEASRWYLAIHTGEGAAPGCCAHRSG